MHNYNKFLIPRLWGITQHTLAVTNVHEGRSAGTRFLSIFLSARHRIPEGLYLNIVGVTVKSEQKLNQIYEVQSRSNA